MTARPTTLKNKTAASKKVVRKKQSRRKTNPKVKKILVFVFVFLLTATILGGYLTFNKINKQFASAESTSSLDQSYSSLLLVVVDDFTKDNPAIKKLEYRIYDFDGKKSYTYNVDTDYKVELGGKFGTEPVSNFLALGALNEDDAISGGIKFVNNAVFKLFAFPVDRYVYIDESSAWGWEGLFKYGQFWPLLLEGRGDGSHTNAKLDELYSLSKFIQSLPEDRAVTATLDETLFSGMDEAFREITIGSKFAQEAKSIAVLNATNTSGVASFGARVINNLGGRVVSIDNSDNKFAEDFIVSDDPEDYTVVAMSRAFGISKIINKESAKQYVTDNQLYRADILLILGK
jgi:hypothetical protein